MLLVILYNERSSKLTFKKFFHRNNAKSRTSGSMIKFLESLEKHRVSF